MEQAAQQNPVAVPAPLGFHGAKVDSAWRLKLPAKFADYVQSLSNKSLYITNIGGEARIYTNGSWLRNLNQLSEDPELKRRMGEYYDSMGGDMDMDPQGRVTIPQNLRKVINLEDKPVMLRFMDDMVYIFTMDQYGVITEENERRHALDLQLAKAKGFLV